MSTIIDSLLVTLGLDSGEFEAKKAKVDKGLKDTGKHSDETGKKLNKAGKDGAAGFDSLSKSAAKFLALIGGTVALKNFITQQVESSAALDRLSRNLRENVSTVSAWSNATEQAGGSAEGLQGSLDMLSKSQTELQLTGQSSLIPFFSALGVSMTGAHGKAKPVTALLLDLAGRFSSMDRQTANNMGRMMGLDQGTMHLLLKGRSEVELMIKRQKEYGAVTKKQAEESSRLKVAMVESRQSFEAFGRELLSAATPALEKFFAIMSEFGAWVRENQEFVGAFLGIMAAGLVAVGLAAIPINMTVAAVIALAGGIALLWQDYQTWKRGGDSLIDYSKWEPGIKAAGAGIAWLRGVAEDAFYRMAAGVDMVQSLLSGDMDRARFAAREFISGKSAAAPAASGEQSPQAFFESKGWSPAQAAGILANLQAESGMRPDAVGDNGKAYGVAQWHPDRQAEFAKWAGKDIRGSSLAEQLAFVHHELTAGNEQRAGAALRGTVTGQRAGEVVSRMYERPADADGEAHRRGLLARSMVLGIPGASLAAQGAGAGSAAAGGGQAGGTRHVETHIGKVEVHTAATDAAGIAKDMGKSLDYLFTSQANYGLN